MSTKDAFMDNHVVHLGPLIANGINNAAIRNCQQVVAGQILAVLVQIINMAKFMFSNVGQPSATETLAIIFGFNTHAV